MSKALNGLGILPSKRLLLILLQVVWQEQNLQALQRSKPKSLQVVTSEPFYIPHPRAAAELAWGSVAVTQDMALAWLSMVAHLWFQLQHAIHEPLQAAAVACRQGWILAAQDLQDQPRQALPIESPLESCHFIQNTPKRPHITLVIVWLVLTYFWGEIVGGANLWVQCPTWENNQDLY